MRWVYLTAVAVIFGVVALDALVDIMDEQLWANTALGATALLVTLFGALYGLRSRWKSNPIGRVFFAKSVVLPLVLIQGAASSWISSEYPGRQHIRFIIYALGAVVYVPMLISLVREQQRDRRRKVNRDG